MRCSIGCSQASKKSFEAAMAQILPLRKRPPDSEDREFLPAALEIVETPASPLGRSITYTIITLFALAILWACLGKVDIVATAKGKIIPSSRTKVIQPFETSVVRAIDVHDGEVVKAGQTLIQLDAVMNDAELKHYESDLASAQLDVTRLHAELSGGDPLKEFQPPSDAPPALVGAEQKFLLDQIAAQDAELAVKDRQRQQKQAEYATAMAVIAKLQATLPILQQRAEMRKTLYNHQTGSKEAYLKILQSLTEEQRDLDVEKRKADEATVAIAALDAERKQTVKKFHRDRYSDLVAAQHKVDDLTQDVVRYRHRAALQDLTSPVDGTVQQLAVHTIGGVVTPAQSLMVIVPAKSHLEIQAMIKNRDIGFVRVGQIAKIKVDAFNFNRYGLIGGTVIDISRDSILRSKPTDGATANQGAGAVDGSSEPANQDLVYAARVSLGQSAMQIDGRAINLSPGMAVTVEIKTGSRRIISYLLSPLNQFKEDALHER
jgi:membrane fusion protein, hemolysin D